MEKCSVCGKAIMSAVGCRYYGGSIHMDHCRGCKYFDSLTWHCLYYIQVVHPAEQLAKQKDAAAAASRRRAELRQMWLKLLSE